MPFIEDRPPVSSFEPEAGELISRKVAQGGVWLFSINLLNRGVGFIRAIILAVVLSPGDFGIFGISLLTLSILETFSQTGFMQALIQKDENITPYLNVTWTLNAGRGIALFLILFLAAPWLAGFFSAPDVDAILRVMAITLLLSGFRNTGVILFHKEMNFRKIFFYEFPAVLTDLMVALILAFLLKSVWALVLGALASGAVRLFMSFVIHPHRPVIELDREKFTTLYGFGRWITGANILIFIVTRGDDLFVGKMLGTLSLGFYQMGQRLSIAPMLIINQAVSRLMLPAFSSMENRKHFLKGAFLTTLNLVAFFTVPIVLVIYVSIPDFVSLVIGEKWKPIVGVTRILVICAWLRSLSVVWGTLYLAKGVPENDFKKNLLRMVVAFAPIYFLSSFFGLPGVAAAMLAGIVAALVYDVTYTIHQCDLGITPVELMKNILFYPTWGILIAIVMVIIQGYAAATAFSLLSIMSVSILFYFSGVFLLNRIFGFFPLKSFRQLLRLVTIDENKQEK